MILGLTPFAVIGIISLNKPGDYLSEQAFGQLEGVRGIKKSQIESFFRERQGDMGVLMETVGTLRNEAFDRLMAVQMIKENQVESYFGERLGDAKVLAGNDTVVSALESYPVLAKGSRAGFWTK